MSWKLSLPLCLVILAAAAGVLVVIFTTEPEAQRSGATRRSAMLVETVGVQRGDFEPVIVALGTVRPAQEVQLASRISGEVVAMSDAFVPGRRISAGEILVTIDDADYRIALDLARSEVAQAEAALLVEAGRQRVAERDYEAFDEELAGEQRALALREPQRRSAEAELSAATAALDQAQLDLDRTAIAPPFDALVLERHVDLGARVGPGDPVAHLVGTARYWIEATVPLSKLHHIAIPTGGAPGADVALRNRTAWPAGVSRAGHVLELIGTLNRETRMARILVAVDDPLDSASGVPPLLIGSVIECRIDGQTLEDVVRLERDYLRDGDTVWTMAEGKLAIREVELAFSDQRYVYIAAGLDADAQVVTTNLATVTEGADLRLAGDEAQADDAEGADE